MIIDTIAEYLNKRDRYYELKSTIDKLERDLAIIISEPKASNPSNELGTSSNDKMISNISRKDYLVDEIKTNIDLLEIYESSYNLIRNEIINIFKDFEGDKASYGKDKVMFYIFYYRMFKRYVLPFEKISEILGVSTVWCKSLDKKLKKEIEKIR